MRKDSSEWPPLSWMLAIERRLTRLESKVFDATTGQTDDSRTWKPRDFMTAGAGIAMVIAAVSEKVGWTTVIAGLTRLFGPK